ncbi:MAG: polymorphic toxin type 17 domain-containing protein [Acidimicrobiales bacterium]
MVGANPEDLRRLAAQLVRATDEVAWLRRRIETAAAQGRHADPGARTLGRLEEWLDRNAAALRRRATRLEEDRHTDASGDWHLPGFIPGRCGTVAVPIQGRRTEADGRDAPLGEPLFASAALQCGPAVEWRRENALQLVAVPGGFVLMAKGGKAGGKGGSGPPASPPTRDDRLRKARLPFDKEAEVAYKPPPDWHPTKPLRWDREQRGYEDAHGNVWRKGRSITPGDPFEWDIQVRPGSRLALLSKDGQHLNVDLRGKITH